MVELKKIISIMLLAVMILSLVGCKKNKPDVEVVSSDTPTNNSSSSSGSSETELAKVNLTKTLKNSQYCDMKYEIAMPDFEFEKDTYDESLPEYSSYTRIYKTDDKKFKYYVSEYLGTERYVGNEDRDYGANSHTEAESIVGIFPGIIKWDTGYTENMVITDNFMTDIGNGMEIMKFCLQLPNELDDYYYVKGYIAVGIKHPVAVYFFDGTPETSYDEEMQAKSLEIIKSIKIG